MEIVHGKRAPMTPISDADYDILKIRDFMEALVYPLHFLDIQYFNRVIPIDGNKPNALLPFACSLQSVDTISAKPVTHSWIWDGYKNPRALLLEIIGKWAGNRGSIIIQFDSCQELLDIIYDKIYPDYKPIRARMLELVKPFNKHIPGELAFNVIELYKAILPEFKITDFSYTCSAEFIQAMYNKPNNLNAQNTIRKLEEYCRQNSELMLCLLRKYAGIYEKAAVQDKWN